MRMREQMHHGCKGRQPRGRLAGVKPFRAAEVALDAEAVFAAPGLDLADLAALDLDAAGALKGVALLDTSCRAWVAMF